MKEKLATLIQSSIKNPNEQEIQAILEIFQEKQFKKGEYFKIPYQMNKRIGFIISGSARISLIKENGEKITGGILGENQFVVDLVGLRTGELNPLEIDFLQISTILVAPIEKIRNLLEVNLTFNRFLREYIIDNIIQMVKLYALFIAGTSKDRYEFMMNNNPELFKNTPLHFIANMIGVTPTQLSRIRKNKKEA